MPIIVIGDISISFPFDPYSVQRVFLSRLLSALNSCSNALLESPTGTGKTICLLCGALSWQKAYPASREHKPRILYASRTHSQLSQVVAELKCATDYSDVNAVVLGSRDQLCVHQTVSKETNAASKIQSCRLKVKTRSCVHYNAWDKQQNSLSKDKSHVVDIEDLVKEGKRGQAGVCPYFSAKSLAATADLVLLPYNYLLDRKARSTHGINLENAVIIFDEAHNIERLCEEAASFQLTSAQLASAFVETQTLLKHIVTLEESNLVNSSLDDKENSPNLTSSALASLASVFHSLEERVTEKAAGFTAGGGLLYSWFLKAGVTQSTLPSLMETMDHAVNYLTELKPHCAGIASLSKMLDVFRLLFPPSIPNADLLVYQANEHFKLYIQVDDSSKKASLADPWMKRSTSSTAPFILNYWCFSPSVVIGELNSQGVRSIILTSGTLSPLDHWASHMRIPFPITLENEHVIGSGQVWAGILHKGPCGEVLDSCFGNRTRPGYLQDLASALANLAKAVPNGLLVFFPSYVVMQSCLEKWKEDGNLARIESHKPVLVEPRESNLLVSVLEKYAELAKEPKGASLFAVCRGKVSEGLDFGDYHGRAVVLTGLPYPPRRDPRVVMKMEHLDSKIKQKLNSNVSGLYGNEWYSQQAMRAVNQAVGRVVRHKRDYGAIILCDQRFSFPSNRDSLSVWLRRFVINLKTFDSVVWQLKSFFKVAQQRFPYKPPPLSSRQECISNNFEELHGELKDLNYSDASLPSSIWENLHKPFHENGNELKSDGSLTIRETTFKSSNQRKRILNDPLCSSTHKEPLHNPEVPLRKKKTTIKLKSGKSLSVNGPKDKVLNAAEFLTEVKCMLCKDSFKTFSQLIKDYKASVAPIENIIQFFSEKFSTDSKCHYLLPGFYRFIQIKDRQKYEDFCLKITGMGYDDVITKQSIAM